MLHWTQEVKAGFQRIMGRCSCFFLFSMTVLPRFLCLFQFLSDSLPAFSPFIFQSTLLIYSMSILLLAAAALHHHVLVVFQHHTFLLVQVEEGDGAKGCRHAAGPWHAPVHGVDQCLHHGMAR